jgi:chromosome transmission fidelity protein 1
MAAARPAVMAAAAAAAADADAVAAPTTTTTITTAALLSRDTFPAFPYSPPYPIQQAFMRELYASLERRQVALLESPTGTGKTLSVICSALAWLEDRRRADGLEAEARRAAERARAEAEAQAAGLPDWMSSFTGGAMAAAAAADGAAAAGGGGGTAAARLRIERRREERRRRRAERRRRLALELGAAGAGAGGPSAAHLVTGGRLADVVGGDQDEDEEEEAAAAAEFLVGGDDDAAAAAAASSAAPMASGAKRAAALLLLEDLEPSSSSSSSGSDREDDDAEDDPDADLLLPRKSPQVVVCSRTHSQLSQFVGEVARTRFADSLSFAALGSRRQLCVNDDVRRLGDPSAINERCLELQRERGKKAAAKDGAAAAGGKKARRGQQQQGRKGAGGRGRGGDDGDDGDDGDENAAKGQQHQACGGRGGQRPPAPKKKAAKPSCGNGCPYIHGRKARRAGAALRDALLATPLDVEDLARLGRRTGACPYYAARRALPRADVVLAPYSAVLSSESREALGLSDLSGCAVVFDEAHNLLDAVNGAHGACASGGQLRKAADMLEAYLARFRDRLLPANAQRVQMTLRVASALAGAVMEGVVEDGGRKGGAVGGTPAAAAEAPGAAPRPPPAAAAAAAAPSPSSSTAAAARVMTVNDLLFGLGLDNINMFELLRWAREQKLAFRVAGLAAAADRREQQRRREEMERRQAAEAAAAKAKAAVSKAAQQLAARARHQQQFQQQQQQVQPPRFRGGGGGNGGSGGSLNLQQQQQDKQQQPHQSSSGIGAMHALASVMSALTSADRDGRVIIEPPEQQQQQGEGGGGGGGGGGSGGGSTTTTTSGRLRFVLLNAAAPFSRVLRGARSVALVSGTLAPVGALAAQLFPSATPGQLRHFECGHVVPARQLLALPLARGPSGRALDFRHAARSEAGLLDEAGRALLTLSAVVPGGLVIFAPSFAYLDALAARWGAATGGGGGDGGGGGGGSGNAAAAGLSLVERLERSGKRVFFEPRSAGGVEAVLAEYAAAIRGEGGGGGGADENAAPAAGPAAAAAAAPGRAQSSSSSKGRGAVLACVVGGKLSEGINFGDDLGRCVVVLGLPYPNPSDPELRERMAHFDALARRGGLGGCAGSGGNGNGGGGGDGHGGALASSSSERLFTGRDYYEGLCFKAVNQAVGRVIRHAGDYAAIVLADARWALRGGGGSGGGGSNGSTSSSAPADKLPGWVQQSFARDCSGDFGDVFRRLAAFYRENGGGGGGGSAEGGGGGAMGGDK